MAFVLPIYGLRRFIPLISSKIDFEILDNIIMNQTHNKNGLNLVDEAYELIDPHPDIHELFLLFDQQFFWGTLTSRACTVDWSKRMTRFLYNFAHENEKFSCAGICQFHGRSGLCSIRLSEPLLKLRKRRDLIETLLVRISY